MKDKRREKSLFKNTLIISIGTICTKLVTFLLLPLYTGILSTEEYGIVDLLTTLVSLLIPIITFQVEQAVFRELLEVRNKDKEKKIIISSSIFSVILQCIFYLLIFIIISPIIKNDYKIFLTTNVLASIFSSLFLQIARGLGDNKKYSIGGFISALTTILFNILFLVGLNMRVNGMLIGTMLGQIFCTLYLFVFLKLYRYISIKSYSWEKVKKLWKYSLPLIPNAISWWVFSSSDRVIVSMFLGLSMNGILAAATKFSNIYITLYNIFNISWTESISVHINDEDIDSYFNNTFELILRVFTGLALLFLSIMPIVYPVMINKNYSFGYYLVPILILGALFNVVVGLASVVYIGKKNTKAIANTSIISAILNIIIHLALIRFLGLYAAAISTFSAYFIMSIYRINDITRKYFPIKINLRFIGISILAFSAIISMYYINNIILNVISILAAITTAYLINKKTIGPVIKMVKSKVFKKWEEV